jgi:hypothetical protein
METLFSIYPNVRDLLATPPEDLAPVLLPLAKGMVQNGMFQPEAVNDIAIAAPHALLGQPGYAFHDRHQIQPLLSRAWNWIERNDLITPAGGLNGRNGWMMFTPRGEQVSDAQDIQRLREAADFPRWMIHTSIAEKVWRALMRDDLGDAVLFAFQGRRGSRAQCRRLHCRRHRRKADETRLTRTEARLPACHSQRGARSPRPSFCGRYRLLQKPSLAPDAQA